MSREPTIVTRRQFVTASGGAVLAGLGLTALGPEAAAATPQAPPSIGGEEALRRLMDGNRRFAAGQARRPNQTAGRRRELARGQQPFAAVLSCSDSRVPPEIVFDQGLGDLFVVRAAGNIADDFGLGSMEYAAAVLGVPLLVVLGHARCGAVEAALKGGDAPGHIASLVQAIRPAADSVRDKPGDRLDNAVRANVVAVVGRLKGTAPILAGRAEQRVLKVVGAHYDLATGGVAVIA